MIVDGQNLDDLPQTLVYNADGTLAYIQVTTPGIPGMTAGGNWRQIFSYTSGNLTGVSAWVKQ